MQTFLFFIILSVGRAKFFPNNGKKLELICYTDRLTTGKGEVLVLTKTKVTHQWSWLNWQVTGTANIWVISTTQQSLSVQRNSCFSSRYLICVAKDLLHLSGPVTFSDEDILDYNAHSKYHNFGIASFPLWNEDNRETIEGNLVKWKQTIFLPSE